MRPSVVMTLPVRPSRNASVGMACTCSFFVSLAYNDVKSVQNYTMCLKPLRAYKGCVCRCHATVRYAGHESILLDVLILDVP